jgi:hypothetical protein
MSGAIVVPLTEMQQLAEQWRATITDMDAMVQHIARDIASIPDNGKGLNEVRSRGRTVGSHHQQLLVQGMSVQKQVVDSVQRFSQADQELAGMVRNYSGVSYTTSTAMLMKEIPSFWSNMWLNVSAEYTLLQNKLADLPQHLTVENVVFSLNSVYSMYKAPAEWKKLIDFINDGKFPDKSGGIDPISGTLASISILKNGYDAYTAYRNGDVQKGREEIANIAGTVGSFALKRTLDSIVPGSGLVITGMQFLSDGMEYSADQFRNNGHPVVANVLDIGADYLDTNGKFRGVVNSFFEIKDAASNGDVAQVGKHLIQGSVGLVTGYENAKRIVDFSEQTTKQVINAGVELYKGAEAKWNETTSWLGNLIPG